MFQNVRKLARDVRGGVTLEWALLLGVMLYPAYWIITKLLATLTAYYGMMVTMNALALP